MAVHQPRFVVAARFLSAMFRLILRPIPLLTLLAVLPIFIIRAQPYDNSELRAFLTPPDGCPAPCFMGIRPGVTTIAETVAILRAHEWVNEFWLDELNFVHFTWNWSGKQPALINAKHTGRVRLIPGHDKVESITIDSNIRIGDLYLLLGLPEKVTIEQLEAISNQSSSNRYQTYYGEYTSKPLGIKTLWGCPLLSFTPWPNLSAVFWNTSVGIIYPATLMNDDLFPNGDRLIYPHC